MHPILDAAFQPYGFLLAGRCRRANTPRAAVSDESSSSSGSATPPQGPADTPRSVQLADLMSSEHEKYLAAKLEFIVPPHIEPVDTSELPSSNYCLFLGHLKFETTPADVRWLVKKLTGVTPLKAEFRGNGCCVVYLATESDESAVRALNRRVLFDHNGVWFARTPDAAEHLMDYVVKVLPRIGGRRRCLRLPRDSLVVEESRSAKKAARRPAQLSTPRMPRGFAGSNLPSPYSLGSPALAGFHIAPPEYALPTDSHASSCDSSAPPPPYMF